MNTNYADSRTPEERANEPRSTLTSTHMNTNPIITKRKEQFREYMSQGYAGGESGLRCEACDRKYSGTASIAQLCPECRAEDAMTEIYEAGKTERAREIVEMIKERPAFTTITAANFKKDVAFRITSKYLGAWETSVSP